jgi:hypothetical protein
MAEQLIELAGVKGLVSYPHIMMDRNIGIPSTTVTNTLFRRAPGAMLNTGRVLQSYRTVQWDTITAIVMNGTASFGRAIQVTCGWGSSLSPPTTEAEVTSLPGSRTIILGGASDPDNESRSFTCQFGNGLFSSLVKPVLYHQDFGYPVFYCWINFANHGIQQANGNLVVITFKCTASTMGVPNFL